MPQKGADAAFDRLAEKIFQAIVDLDPVLATWLGVHGPSDFRLPDRSREACEVEVSILQGLLKELSTIREKDLSADRLVDLRLARGGLTARMLRHLKHPCWRESPGSYVDDSLFGLYSLLIREYAPAPKRARALLGRMREVPRLLDQAQENIENPSPIFTEAGSLAARGALTFFDTALRAWIGGLDEPRLKASLEKARCEARSAMERYRDWLEGNLMPRSKGEFAIGKQLYERLLVEQHGLLWSCDDLIGIGQRVYQETMREMKRVAARIDPTRPWSKVVEQLKTAHPLEGDLLDRYREEMERARRFVLEQGLVMVPKGEWIEVVPTPEFARPMLPYAAYLSPAPFEMAQKGFFWVTPIDPEADPAHREMLLKGHATHGIAVTALHEAYPGHHLQLVHSNRVAGHKLRQIFRSSTFAEGWALYCEDMMYRQGFYSEDRARLLQLKDLLWRACRVIIDVELQTGRMGFNEAVSFLVRKAHIERPHAVAEVRRYCANPTQPMSYVAGKIQIEELLQDFKAAKGTRFNLREFHDDLLSHGTIPIELIRLEMGLPRHETVGRHRRVEAHMHSPPKSLEPAGARVV